MKWSFSYNSSVKFHVNQDIIVVISPNLCYNGTVL